MNCRSCGSELPERARFCGQCGTPSAGAADGAENMAASGPSALERPDASIKTAPLRRRRKALASAAVSVAVLAAALVVTGWKERWPAAAYAGKQEKACHQRHAPGRRRRLRPMWRLGHVA